MKKQTAHNGRPEAVGRVIILAALAALALLVVGCGGEAETVDAVDDTPEIAEVPRNVRVLTLEVGEITEYFEISGPVQPVVGTDVTCEEIGTVVAVHSDKGDRVAKGDVLVEIDRRLLRSDREASRAALELASYNNEKTRELFDAGKVSRIEMLTAAQEFAAAKSAAEVAEIRYDRAAVKAPFDGLVTDRYVEPGQLVSTVGPVARVINPYTLKLVGTLTEREVSWINEGDGALVELDGHAGTVSSVVHWVGFEADPLNGKFKVEIRIPNADLALRSGVVGRARLVKAEHGNVVVIPRDAVINDPNGEAVYVIEEDRAKLQMVTLGMYQGLMVVVTEGLAPGDDLVVRGQRDLLDGSLVEVTSFATDQDGSMGGDPVVVRNDESQVRTGSDQEGIR